MALFLKNKREKKQPAQFMRNSLMLAAAAGIISLFPVDNASINNQTPGLKILEILKCCPAYAQQTACPSCGYENLPGAKKCANCNAALGASVKTDVPAPQSPAKPTGPVKPAGPAKPVVIGPKPPQKPLVTTPVVKKNQYTYFDTGNEYFAKKQYVKAKEEFKAAYEMDPTMLPALLKLGISYYKANYFEDSARVLDEYIKKDPKQAEAYYYMSQINRYNNEESKELQNLKKAVSLNPNYAIALNNIAIHSIRNRSYEEAITNLQKAVAANPEYYIAYVNLAGAYIYKGMLDEAQQALETALKINPDYYLIYYNMGVIYSTKNKIEDAINQFENALKANPDHADSIANKASMLNRLSRFKEAAELLKHGLVKNSKSAALHLNLAICYDKLGMTEESTNENNTANKLVPGYNITACPHGIILGAITCYDYEDTEQVKNKEPKLKLSLTTVVNVLDKKIDQKLDQLGTAKNDTQSAEILPEAAFKKGDELFKQNKFNEAMDEFKKAVSAKKDYYEAYEKLAYCFGAIGKYDDATEFLNKVIALKADYAGAYISLSRILLTRGDNAKALENIQKALEKDPKNPEAHYLAGIIYKIQGKNKQAADSFKQYLDLAKDSARREIVEKTIETLK